MCDFTEDTFVDRLSLLRYTAELLVFPSPILASLKSDALVSYLETLYKLLDCFLPSMQDKSHADVIVNFCII